MKLGTLYISQHMAIIGSDVTHTLRRSLSQLSIVEHLLVIIIHRLVIPGQI
jgi:hypothetical protein